MAAGDGNPGFGAGVLAAAALSVALVACGGDDDDSDSTGSTGASRPSSGTAYGGAIIRPMPSTKPMRMPFIVQTRMRSVPPTAL